MNDGVLCQGLGRVRAGPRCLDYGGNAEDRCAASHNCSIRPVWMMLQKRIDDVLSAVSLADLLEDEPTVRERVGLPILETV